MVTEPKTLEEAKAMVSGTLGLEMERYPLRFASVAYFGPSLKRDMPITVRSGSASLLVFGGKPVVVTCSHVLQGYRDMQAEIENCFFQIGNCKLNPLAQLIDESQEFDIAVIALTDKQVQEVTNGKYGFGEFFVDPPVWPPASVIAGEFVAYGGYPGELRKALSFNELSFGSYSSGASRVTATHDNFFVCQFEREHWVTHHFEPEPTTIRGMSGGPVFAIRRSKDSGLVTYEFVGIIYQFSEEFELLYVRLAGVLGSDGSVTGLLAKP
jgi:hypothetical protein